MMTEIEALSKIVDAQEHEIAAIKDVVAVLVANQVDKVKLKAFIIKLINDKVGVSPKTRFVEPTAKELNDYLKEVNRQWKEGNSAENFIGFYGSKGWIVGKVKMVSWKKAVCTNSWTEPYVQSKGTTKVAYCAKCTFPKDKCKC